ELDQNIRDRIINDIKKAVTKKYKLSHQFLSSFIDEYVNINPEVIVKNKEIIDGSIVIVLAVSFFLIINYGCSSSNEIIIEKSSGVLNIILTNIDAKKHLLEKIIVSYIIFLIQIAIIIFQLLISYLIRFIQDGCSGLLLFANRFLIMSTESEAAGLTIEKIILLAIVMIFNLLLIQLIIILITSKYTNGQQMASFQGLLYVGLLIAYYLIMIVSEQLRKSRLIKYLSYLPLFSMVFVPQRIISSNISTFSALIALILVLLAIIFLVIRHSENYKRNLLIQK
ncbi:MAG TPA: ABC transporter permease, partial [Erysipelotrichaceae bacterium]|nr:ABC transporter permease [Erysipelotrichaceae bacterium]